MKGLEVAFVLLVVLTPDIRSQTLEEAMDLLFKELLESETRRQIKSGIPVDFLSQPKLIAYLKEKEEAKSLRDKEAEMTKKEQAAGDLADISPNRHRHVPAEFPDFSRRFVLQYPYTEKQSSQVNEEAEYRLNRAVKKAIQQISEDDRLRPVKAPPEVVLAVAKQSALFERSKPKPEPVDRDHLRTGEFWNAVWKEDVPDPAKTNLRSDKHIESIKVKIMPGSKLHKLVALTRDMSPRYLYIMNNANNNDNYDK